MRQEQMETVAKAMVQYVAAAGTYASTTVLNGFIPAADEVRCANVRRQLVKYLTGDERSSRSVGADRALEFALDLVAHDCLSRTPSFTDHCLSVPGLIDARLVEAKQSVARINADCDDIAGRSL